MKKKELKFLVRDLKINEGRGYETRSLCYISAKCMNETVSINDIIRISNSSKIQLKDLQINPFIKEESGAEYVSVIYLERVGPLWEIVRIEK